LAEISVEAMAFVCMYQKLSVVVHYSGMGLGNKEAGTTRSC